MRHKSAQTESPLPLAGEGNERMDARGRATHGAVAEGEGVTFIDAHYQQRDIEIDGAMLEVRGGRVTVTDPTLIDALDKTYGMTREKN
ncbi:MAG: hypothetical protein HY272_01995 [Gammaproteobacteria bacterium]|nr:hypothetical protein [Gammaproteobacteria bacterium]